MKILFKMDQRQIVLFCVVISCGLFNKFYVFGLSSNFLLENNAVARFLNISCEYLCPQNLSTTHNCRCDLINIDKSYQWPSKNTGVELLCRESNKIVLKVCENMENSEYFLEAREEYENTWNLNNWSNTSCFVIIDNLTENHNYQFRIWYKTNSEIFIPVETNYIKTKILNNPPKPIVNMNLISYGFENNNYKAIISWKPSEDKSCNHEFVWFGGNDLSDYTQLEIEIPYNFSLTLEKLLFNSNYSIAVMTKNSDWSLESKKLWLHFRTPSCLEVLHSLQFCVPLSPTGINAQETLITLEQQQYNINITWDLPNLIPDYYIIHLNLFKSEGDNDLYLNISGNSTNAEFENVSLNLHYQITLFAYSLAGRSDPGEFYKQINNRDGVAMSTSTLSDNIFLFVLLPIMIIIGVIVAIILVVKEFYRRENNSKRENYFEEMELKTHYLDTSHDIDMIEKTDEWEVDLKLLSLNSILGQGAFGIVRMGWLQKDDNKIAVAVKMLPKDHRQSDVREFRQEIEIMKSVGSHPHIVSLIGCVTKGKPQNLRLIVEYCARGDLLTYLRTAWEEISNQCSNIQYANVVVNDSTNIDNKLYLLGVNETFNMQIKDLISIGLQIAMGMEHLSNLHVLHRDLAARNVLVCENRTVKVSDFGLSRDVYRDNVYCKTSSGKLPIRWLALESLTHQVYTTQSDVWSYGILLWEIITLGASPYPGVQTHELLELLMKGTRMSCPPNCSGELYDIMIRCWNNNPKDRPSFCEIRHLLENILEETSDYLNLNIAQSFDSLEVDVQKINSKFKSISSEIYVKTFAL